MSDPRLRANAAALVTMALWGAQVPILSELAGRWDPFLLSALRFAMSASLFYVVVKLVEPGPFIPAGVRVARLWLLGGIGMAGFGTCFMLGVAYSHPITAAVVTSCSPIIAALVAWVFFGTRPRLAIAPALALAALGSLLATVQWKAGGVSFELGGGEILIVASSVFWSWYSISAQRWLTGYSQLRITGLTMWPAALSLTAIWLVLVLGGVGSFRMGPATLHEVGLLAWASLGANAVGTMLWNYSVRHLGVVVASFFINLLPLVAIGTAMVFGIQPRSEQLLGCGLVIIGIVYAQLDSMRVERASRRPG